MPDKVLQHLTDDQPQALERLCELLAIPSVSTDPAYAADVHRAAEWVANTLREIGLNADVRPTDGHPIVIAHTPEADAPADAPHVLFYGHYDVQPPDPVDHWVTPPFEPHTRSGAIYARGASDDKGQVMCFIEALRAWKQTHGKLPARVSLMIEGEEECGSVSMAPFLEKHRDELGAADLVLISDTMMWNRETLSITYGLRGLVYFDVQLHNANRDTHSGMFGGVFANPATMLTQVLARLFDDQHRITIPGFYDDVLPLTDDERDRWAKLNYDEMADCLTPIGVDTPFGEAGFTMLQRKWARPACDINGLYGGYGGEGAKTVIPSFAGAKVSFRIPPNMDPAKVADQFEAWLKSHETHGCRWRITRLGEAAPVVVSSDSPFITAAQRACRATTGNPAVLVREGATIPVVSDFKQTLGLDSLLIGFGRADDCLHAPNEKFDIECFELGCRTHAALLAELGAVSQ